MKNSQDHSTSTSTSTWAEALRRPWTALAAAAAVVLGPAAVTASALDQANAAPQHHATALKAEQTQAYLPTDTTRRRAA
ncbi:hypothetical protein SUDANB145_05308 [Streptomyces sp. enrichment culture]|uniref:hypothetical protein n=1 Tax=Streptomyces sp. enrichment culture TaxID=1795815 RepID=UPI003F57DB1C